MSTQPSLFDDTDTPGTSEGAKVPFGVALLAFGSVQGLGFKAVSSLVGKFGENLGNALGLPESELLNVFRECELKGADKLARDVANNSAKLIAHAETELKRLEGEHVHIVPASRLPGRLSPDSMGSDAPKWLFVQGNEHAFLSARLVVAVVGTRTPTARGMDATKIVADILGTYPVVVVSGLAEGIDGQAHYCSLQHDVTNLAFLGHGTNIVFPQDTAEIRRDIVCKGGAVLSEYLPWQSYQKWQFVERNRLQAGLASLVIPVEAKATSGTAHTIRFARKYHRRLVGVRWDGANGIVDDLRANHEQLIDIFTDKGQRELNDLVQELVRRELQDQYPFKNLERSILREFGIRKYTESDVARLVEAINAAAHQKRPQERPDNGTT